MKHILLLFVLTLTCCTRSQFPTKIDGVLVEYAPCSDEHDRKFWLHFPHEVNDEIHRTKLDGTKLDGVTYIGYLDKYSVAVEVGKAFDPMKVITNLIVRESNLSPKN